VTFIVGPLLSVLVRIETVLSVRLSASPWSAGHSHSGRSLSSGEGWKVKAKPGRLDAERASGSLDARSQHVAADASTREPLSAVAQVTGVCACGVVVW